MSNCTYYFYDHGILRFTGEDEAIERAIRNHDHNTFMKYYRKYEGNGMLPRYASYYLNDKMYVDIDMTDEMEFSLVSDSESEWG